MDIVYKHAGIQNKPPKVSRMKKVVDKKISLDADGHVDVFNVAKWTYPAKYKCYDKMINHIV